MTDERSWQRRADAATGLRTAAVWSAVEQVAGERTAALGRPLTVLDLGGGSGGLAVPLALQGHTVHVVDPSPDALASLVRRAREEGVQDAISASQGDAESLPTLLGTDRVDLVCCHGTLEHVDDPQTALAALAAVLAPQGVISLVTANRMAAVLSRALAGRFDQARTALGSEDGRWGEQDPVPRRFDRPALRSLVEEAGLRVTSIHPVRVFVDLVPSSALESDADRAALLALETEASTQPALAGLGSAIHLLAVRD